MHTAKISSSKRFGNHRYCSPGNSLDPSASNFIIRASSIVPLPISIRAPTCRHADGLKVTCCSSEMAWLLSPLTFRYRQLWPSQLTMCLTIRYKKPEPSTCKRKRFGLTSTTSKRVNVFLGFIPTGYVLANCVKSCVPRKICAACLRCKAAHAVTLDA